MKIWLLEVAQCHLCYDGYDKFLIAAPDEQQARNFADESCGCEGAIWGLPKETTCTLLTDKPSIQFEHEEPVLLMGSFNAG